MTLTTEQLDTGLRIRRAAKDHICTALTDVVDETTHRRLICRAPISKGERYLEYLGESYAYQSGFRYCAEHALSEWHVDVARQQS